MRKVRILEEASQEAIEAASWFESSLPGLGEEFFNSIKKGIDVIEENILPLSPLPYASNSKVKRLVLDRFPYSIIALETSDEVILVAFAHHSRKPEYWKNRKLF
ncbi:hypothetical protein [Marinospirillum insulare]|uniref:ParE toxin of type II toxin-antitoxin system, parDE n=1 Tax=Marinospirillum insulare TaxID=217169 RepID=A0ABQ5ZYI1_9GAMM|nr:hypothetical protein [Marinospirillum insulare]GLR63412.1 hypothetical protein GCM10007878_08470 [Marinospirillum insulare]